MNKNNPYGYKVGYCENGSRLFCQIFYDVYLQPSIIFTATLSQITSTDTRYKPSYRRSVLGNQTHYEKGVPCRYMGRNSIPIQLRIFLYRWAHCSIVKTRSQREKIFDCSLKSFLLQKFLSFLADFGATLNSYMECPFSLCYFGPADKGK